MILGKFFSSFHHLTTVFTFYDGSTNRTFLAHCRFMPVEILLAFKEPIAVCTKHPGGNGTVLSITQLTGITVEMIFDFIITFPTRVAVFFASEECRNA